MLVILLCYFMALVGSLALIRYHINLSKYPIYYCTSLALAIYLPISVAILLPLDYIAHNGSVTKYFVVSDRIILWMWKVTYWSTFLLTWLILPILQEYCRAGNFSKMKKLKESFRKNFMFQAITLSCSVTCGIYLVFEVGLSLKNLKSMIIGLSHIYSLTLALWSMAHGLIAIPKNRWIQGSIETDLYRMYMRFPKLIDIVEETKSDLIENVNQILVLKECYTNPGTSYNFPYRDWILELFEQIPREFKEPNRHFFQSERRDINRHEITESTMSKLTCNFHAILHRYNSYSSEIDAVFRRITHLQRLADAKSISSWSERQKIIGYKNSLFLTKLTYYFRCLAIPLAARFQSIVMFLLSFAVIESEFFHSTNLSLVNLIVFKKGIFQQDWSQASSLSFFFLYMLFCSINSLAKLKVFNIYHLVPKESDPVSACFYASHIARMTIPLSYNFLSLFFNETSVFEKWYGQSVHLTGLFNMLNNWIPRLLFIPIVFTTFGFYDKIKSKMGITFENTLWAGFDGTDFENDVSESFLMSNMREIHLMSEAKRLVAMESNRRAAQGIYSKTSLREAYSSLSQMASNSITMPRESFDDSYMGFSHHIPDSGLTHLQPPSVLWRRFGAVLSNVKNTFHAKFGIWQHLGNPEIPYHD